MTEFLNDNTDREMWVQKMLNVLLKFQGGLVRDPGVTSSPSVP